uniref:Mediator of RNA polymerase II transcription subunit 7 n=1 Tax=Strongyloides papillosus TaxID=174720 RepID=A0A0N5B2L2_STREA
MNTAANSGVTLKLTNEEAEKLIKFLINHPKFNDFTPRERRSYETDDPSEFLNIIEKLEDNLKNTCKIIRSFIKQSEQNNNDISKMIDAERQDMENCFSFLNERISIIQRLVNDKIVELVGKLPINDENPNYSTSDSTNDDVDSS